MGESPNQTDETNQVIGAVGSCKLHHIVEYCTIYARSKGGNMQLSDETRKNLIDERRKIDALLGDEPTALASQLGRPVLVTTDKRGVFFGYAADTSSDPIVLLNARNCIYWHKSIGGFAGLAVTGPNEQCRIGAKVSQIELRGICSVSEVESVAVEAWEKASCVS